MKILIWGTGQLSIQTAKKIQEGDIAGYIDTYATKRKFAQKPLYKPEEINNIEYDAILVSTLWVDEIVQTCQEFNIALNKVIFVYGNAKILDMNQDYGFVEKVCGKNFSDFIKRRYHLIREIEIDLNRNKKEFSIEDFFHEKYYRNDYVRLKTFELLVDEIERGNIKGQVAELGVYQGHFAQFLNAAFSDRKLYLFDTFEGFDEEELEKELESDLVSVARDIYKNTSVQTVMEKMIYKENVVIKQGFFPESLEGLEEEFAFVSLDCDWEESLYQGLYYFYPRLCEGGYIMIHDYNNFLDCAKKAVKRYEADKKIRIPKVPICDAQGSLILTK